MSRFFILLIRDHDEISRNQPIYMPIFLQYIKKLYL